MRTKVKVASEPALPCANDTTASARVGGDEHILVGALHRVLADGAHPDCVACTTLLPLLSAYLAAMAGVA